MSRRAWSAVGVLGEVLVTLGVVLALFVVYQVWWTDLASGRRQHEADADLDRAWAQPEDPANPRGHGAQLDGSTAFARLFVPALGSDFRFAVVEGTDADALEVGPGHYPGTQLPGEPGNFAVAGHRVGRGAPFNDLDAVRTCDAVVVETRQTWSVYRVLPVGSDDGRASSAPAAQAGWDADAARCLPPETVARLGAAPYARPPGRQIVDPGDIDVIDPVPGTRLPAAPDSLPLITLTTCHPQFSAAERMILHGVLVRSEPKVPGRAPAELEVR